MTHPMVAFVCCSESGAIQISKRYLVYCGKVTGPRTAENWLWLGAVCGVKLKVLLEIAFRLTDGNRGRTTRNSHTLFNLRWRTSFGQ